MKFLKYPSTLGLPLEVSATEGAAETLVDGTGKAEDRETVNRKATLAKANNQTAAAMTEKPEKVVKQRTLLVAEECSVDAAGEAAEVAGMEAAAAAYQSCSTAEPVVIVQ